jgi:hypothetical protein
MSSSDGGLGLTVPGLVAVLAIIGVFIIRPDPLETLRPPNPDLTDQPFSDQKVQARLWQDPFEAAERSLKSQPSGSDPAVARMIHDLTSQVMAGTAVDTLPENTDQTGKVTLDTKHNRIVPITDSSSDQHITPPYEQSCQAGIRTKILAVLVGGGPYAESAEVRLRTRYAILSALNVSGYQPCDATHVGYYLPTENQIEKNQLPRLVPYERLERKSTEGSPENLLLLWLNSDAFKQHPIFRIRTLVSTIPKSVIYQKDLAKDSIKVIGPVDSDGLVALLKEVESKTNESDETEDRAERVKDSDHRPFVRRLEFYSAMATATDASLLLEAYGDQHTKEIVARFANDKPATVENLINDSRHEVKLRRLIPDDGHLASQLEEELADRGIFKGRPPGSGGLFAKIDGVSKSINRWFINKACSIWNIQGERCNPEKQGKHIVLISEWDTTYGRYLPVAVANTILQKHQFQNDKHQGQGALLCERDPATETKDGRCKEGQLPLKTMGELDCYDRLHYFSYMRGLDGNIPALKNKQESRASASQSDSAKLKPGPTPSNERAEGQGQLDYLRRLTDEVANLKNPDGSSARVSAIGVLGSDLHDKMLILEALRPVFRTTLFFTTDMDSRMFDSAYASSTQGLIVASGFGLRPGEFDRDATIPPFRGNYQTAVYHAVRMVFPMAKSQTEVGVADCVESTPKSFVTITEIGRNGARQEFVRTPLSQECKCLRGGEANEHAQKDFIDWFMTVCFFIAILIGVFIFYRPGSLRFLRRHPLGMFALVILVLVVYRFIPMILQYLHLDLLGCPIHAVDHCSEPFSLTSGISGWMPIYLNFIALVLSILSIPMLYLMRSRTIGEIERRYIAVPAAERPYEFDNSMAMRDHMANELLWLSMRMLNLILGLRRMRDRLLKRTKGAGFSRPDTRASRGTYEPVSGLVIPEDANQQPIAARQIWIDHRRLLIIGWHSLRPLLLGLLFYFFVLNLFNATGGGASSGALRGEDLREFAANLRFPSMLVLSLLVFFYLDLTARARELIKNLSAKDVIWPEEVREYYSNTMLKVDPCFIDRWISLRVVARYTDVAVRTVIFPLLVLLLLVIARLPWFDTNMPPTGIMVAYIVLAFYLLVSAWLTQRAARRLRDEILAEYRRRLREQDTQNPAGTLHRHQLEDLIERVESMRDFAFQRFSENPLVRAAILPFGSLGIGLLEFLG